MTVTTFAGISTANRVIHVVDPLTSGNEDGYGMGYLRSLPLLLQYDVAKFTFPRGWLSAKSTETFDAVVEEFEEGQFRYNAVPELAFDYVLIDTDQQSGSLEFEQLCQVTSQELENSQGTSTTHKLMDAYKSGRIEELFIITDTADFKMQASVSQKPMAEDIDHISQLDYPALAKNYIDQTFEKLRLSLGETLNIWLHHAAAEYEEVMGAEPTQIRDLFEFDVLKPGIRTWDVLEFLSSDIAKDDPEHIEAVTRPWVESDNSVIETYIRNALQEFDYDREKVRAYRDEDN
jgi:hypothetical protein